MTDSTNPPVTTDQDVHDLVERIIGEAIRPQCWVLLLDRDARALPVVLPIDDVPVVADPRDADRFAAAVDRIAYSTGAAAVVLVQERPGPDDLTPTEAAWLRNVRRSFDGYRTSLRAQLLVHDGGVRLVDAAAVFGRPVEAARG